MQQSLSSSILPTILLILINSLQAKEYADSVFAYGDYFNETFCSSLIKMEYQVQQSVQVLISYRINISNIFMGQPVISNIQIQRTFIAIVVFFFIVLLLVYLQHKQLAYLGQNLIKSNLSFKEDDNSHLTARTSKLIKRLILFLLIFNVYNSIKGIKQSNQTENAFKDLICKHVNFPNRNFARYSQKKYYSFNEYQLQLVALRQKVNEITSQGILNLEKLKRFNYKNKTTKFQSLLTSLMNQNHIKDIKRQTFYIEYIKNQSQRINNYLTVLREQLYEIKVGIFQLQSSVNSYIRLENLPKIIKSLSLQIHLIFLIGSFVMLACLFLFLISQKQYQNSLLHLVNMTLSFSILLALCSALFIHLFLHLPYQTCLILSSQHQKLRNIQQIDKNKIKELNQIFMLFGFKKKSDYYQTLEDQLIFMLPQEIDEIKQYTSFSQGLNTIISQNLGLLRENLLGIDQNASLQRFNLTNLYEYQQKIYESLCRTNISIWQNSINLCLLHIFTNLSTMMLLIVYLKSKFKPRDKPMQEENIKLVEAVA